MARFRRKAKRRSYSGFMKRSSSRRKSSSSMSVTDVLLAGAIYGVARSMIVNMLPTFFSFGPVDSDNAILGTAGFFASKQSNKLIKSVGLIAMGTEAGLIANNVVANKLNSNVTGYVYG